MGVHELPSFLQPADFFGIKCLWHNLPRQIYAIEGESKARWKTEKKHANSPIKTFWLYLYDQESGCFFCAGNAGRWMKEGETPDLAGMKKTLKRLNFDREKIEEYIENQRNFLKWK